jgi:hypothetical protein
LVECAVSELLQALAAFDRFLFFITHTSKWLQ